MTNPLDGRPIKDALDVLERTMKEARASIQETVFDDGSGGSSERAYTIHNRAFFFTLLLGMRGKVEEMMRRFTAAEAEIAGGKKPEPPPQPTGPVRSAEVNQLTHALAVSIEVLVKKFWDPDFMSNTEPKDVEATLLAIERLTQLFRQLNSETT